MTGIVRTPITKTTLRTLFPQNRTTEIAATKDGKAADASRKVRMTRSVRPRQYAAVRPTRLPPMNPMAVAASPTKTEIRAPLMAKPSMSIPRLFVPNGCENDGACNRFFRS